MYICSQIPDLQQFLSLNWAWGSCLAVSLESLFDTGSSTLMTGVNFRYQKGDKIGLVGANDASVTTMKKSFLGKVDRNLRVIRISNES